MIAIRSSHYSHLCTIWLLSLWSDPFLKSEIICQLYDSCCFPWSVDPVHSVLLSISDARQTTGVPVPQSQYYRVLRSVHTLGNACASDGAFLMGRQRHISDLLWHFLAQLMGLSSSSTYYKYIVPAISPLHLRRGH